MPLPEPVAAALSTAGVPFAVDVPLRKKTWWRTGGPADGFARVERLDQLVAVQRVAAEHDLPVFCLGNASNLLVSDRGIRGLVVRLKGELAAVEASGDPPRLRVGGGARLVSLVQRMQREGWTGLELFAGIPGTVGGAVRMNAGTALGETADALVDATLVLRGGEVRTVPASDLRMRYRHAELPAGAIAAFATLRTTGEDPETSRARIAHHLAYRARTQPVDVPTCGSTFRNPPGDTAGRLIEAAGLKGFALGGARVSPKHANFIENTGGATAAEIRALIEHVQATVATRFGVRLEREVHFAGEW